MKNKLFILFGYIIILMISFNQAISQPTLMHYWHFNNTLPSDGSGGILFGQNPIYADYSITTEPAYVIYKAINEPSADTGTVDNCNGKSKNERPEYGGCCGTINNGIRTRNPSDNMEFLWYIPTTNYENIILTYATESSSALHGQLEQDYSYSIDGGSNFITTDLLVGLYNPDTTWKKVTLDLSNIPSINNNNKLIFRIIFNGQTTGTKGNNRFDNITVEGNNLFPNKIEDLNYNGYSLTPNPAGNYIILKSVSEKSKIISIYNSVGIKISVYQTRGNNLNINTSQLNPGFYFMNVVENNSGKIIRLKFLKK
jgi:hypothetical protein